MTTQNYIQDDEIDLKNLVNIIWNGKIFIIFFTLAITILSAIYILFSIPVYEAKSVVRIGYIDNVLLEEPKVLEQKLKLIFDVENNNPIEENSAYVKMDYFTLCFHLFHNYVSTFANKFQENKIIA